jgi:hypothetical protein
VWNSARSASHIASRKQDRPPFAAGTNAGR